MSDGETVRRQMTVGAVALCVCGEPVAACDAPGCRSGETLCRSCDWECFHEEAGTAECRSCETKRMAYWAWYFGGAIKARANSCEALGISSSSSDLEVMRAAKGVK